MEIDKQPYQYSTQKTLLLIDSEPVILILYLFRSFQIRDSPNHVPFRISSRVSLCAPLMSALVGIISRIYDNLKPLFVTGNFYNIFCVVFVMDSSFGKKFCFLVSLCCPGRLVSRWFIACCSRWLLSMCYSCWARSHNFITYLGANLYCTFNKHYICEFF